MLKSNKKEIVNRLHRIEGQIRGLEKMVLAEKYCVDIITQSLAIKRSLDSFSQILLKNHLQEHVAHQFSHGEKSKAVNELLKVFNLHNRS